MVIGTPRQASVSTARLTEHSVESAKLGWYVSLGSSKKPSYCPKLQLETLVLLKMASLLSSNSASVVCVSTNDRAMTCSKCDCTMSRTWPTVSKKPPRPSRPRVSNSVTTTRLNVVESHFAIIPAPTLSFGSTRERNSMRCLLMKKDNQWSTRCKLESVKPGPKMSLCNLSAVSMLVPKGFSAATCTRSLEPWPQFLIAASLQAPKTEGGTLR
mmetsp:Transcript_11153/g.29733  ORF Transcript_11153/g.29733 Transcript_11153/m.29733 type:complete len:213 (-) Transcript_11153:500-1138(-)